MRHTFNGYRRLSWILFATGLCACTGPGTKRPTCPESREVRCLTEMVCAHDDKRDCDVCACAPPAGGNPRPPGRQDSPQDTPDPAR